MGLLIKLEKLFGQPTIRGFFCDDESIKYPLIENTVGEWTVLLCSIFIPLLVIICTEIWHHGIGSGNIINIYVCSFPMWIKNMAKFYGGYLLGINFVSIITELSKFTTGRLRPNFISMCNPNIDCSLESNWGKYIENYTCSGDTDNIFESRLSFPSGHASLSFCAATYIVAYIEASPKWGKCGIIKNFVQFLFILAAWYISLTRVKDHWHHWSDVLVGAGLGTFSAFAMILLVVDIKLLILKYIDELLPIR